MKELSITKQGVRLPPLMAILKSSPQQFSRVAHTVLLAIFA